MPVLKSYVVDIVSEYVYFIPFTKYTKWINNYELNNFNDNICVFGSVCRRRVRWPIKNIVLLNITQVVLPDISKIFNT